MEIFYYGIDNNRGGMEIYAFNLIKSIVVKDPTIHFHILTCFKDMCFKKELEDLGCIITVLPPKKHLFRFYKSFCSVLKKADKKDSLIQLNIMTCRNLMIFKAAKRSKIKTMIVNHGSKINSLTAKVSSLIFRLFYGRFAINIGVSKESLRVISKKENTRNLVINNGISPIFYEFNARKRVELRKKYNIKDNEFVIGQVGRISKLKNQIFSCRLINRLDNKTDISLQLFGNNQDSSVDRYISQNRLSNFIQNHDAVPNINDIYNILDLFLFPSISEGAGIALYEALANGLNCIVSENVPDVDISSNKIVKLPLDEKMWIDEINKLRNNKNYKRDNLLIGSKYDLDVQIDNYLHLYKNLLSSH